MDILIYMMKSFDVVFLNDFTTALVFFEEKFKGSNVHLNYPYFPGIKRSEFIINVNSFVKCKEIILRTYKPA